MNDHRRIVEHFDEVKRNVVEFHTDLQSHRELMGKLSQFKHWYYLPDLDRFGPSKYIGYKGMNFETYKLHHKERMDGGRTEDKLKIWFAMLSTESLESDILYEKLREFLNSHEKKLKSNAVIHVPKGWKVDNDRMSEDVMEKMLFKMSDDENRREVGGEAAGNGSALF